METLFTLMWFWVRTTPAPPGKKHQEEEVHTAIATINNLKKKEILHTESFSSRQAFQWRECSGTLAAKVVEVPPGGEFYSWPGEEKNQPATAASHQSQRAVWTLQMKGLLCIRHSCTARRSINFPKMWLKVSIQKEACYPQVATVPCHQCKVCVSLSRILWKRKRVCTPCGVQTINGRYGWQHGREKKHLLAHPMRRMGVGCIPHPHEEVLLGTAWWNPKETHLQIYSRKKKNPHCDIMPLCLVKALILRWTDQCRTHTPKISNHQVKVWHLSP